MQVDRHAVREMVGAGAQLVDVLPARAYAAEHVPDALNVPLQGLGRETVGRLDPGRPVIVYCHDDQ